MVAGARVQHAPPVRIDLLPNGIVDDLAVDLADVTIERTGEARFMMRISGAGDVELEIWTTRKQRVRVSPWEDAPKPEWVLLETATTDELESLRATRCGVHFEQMDRASYFLGLEREPDRWGLFLRAHGYLSARVVRAPASER